MPLAPGDISLRPADGNLNIFNLPVGQGDAQVVQCPSGEITLVDLGSNQWPGDTRFWGNEEIQVGHYNVLLLLLMNAATHVFLTFIYVFFCTHIRLRIL